MSDLSTLQKKVIDRFRLQPGATTEVLREFLEPADADAIDIPFWNPGMPVAPAVVDEATNGEIAAACRDLMAGMDILLSTTRSRQYLTAISRFSPEELELCDDMDQIDYLSLARADIILAGNRVGITELNATSRIGYAVEYDLLVRRLERSPAFAATVAALGLRNELVFPSIRNLIAQLAESQPSPAVSITIGHRLAEVPSFFLSDVLKSELESSGLPVVIAGLEDLSIEDSRVCHPDIGRIGVIYRIFGPWGRSAHDPQSALRRLRRVSAQGGVVVLDGFVGECRVTKLPLILLSDERWLDLMPGELAERLRSSVLWTRLLQDDRTEYAGRTIDLLPFILENRHEFVLKPGRGTGGRGLVIGAETSQPTWESYLARALHAREPWVIQQVMWPDAMDLLLSNTPGSLSVINQIVSYGAVLVNRRYAGLMRKNGNAGQLNLNSVQGVASVPVYVLPENPCVR